MYLEEKEQAQVLLPESWHRHWELEEKGSPGMLTACVTLPLPCARRCRKFSCQSVAVASTIPAVLAVKEEGGSVETGPSSSCRSSVSMVL